MISHVAERAVESALASGNALLKFLSPNDVGLTASHQEGFYLPIGAHRMYTPHPPANGVNNEEEVEVLWQDGTVTKSRIKWYGKGTRHEYRLTRFGKEFPFHNADVVGDLWVLVPKDHWHFEAFLLDRDEDIQELLAALGVEPFARWGVYQEGAPQFENETVCLERLFRKFVDPLLTFPTGDAFSAATREFVNQCDRKMRSAAPDYTLLRWMEAEYALFRMAERQICQPDIARTFEDVDAFLETAARIMNRRKARAGRSLENHVDHVLTAAGIPHQMRQQLDGKPDVIIPNAAAYLDESYPVEKLRVIGIKTTCKDRWRQVLNEAKRVPRKHILTMQPGISANQLTEMNEAGVTLIVPEKLHKDYPDHPIRLLTLDEFITDTRALLTTPD
jgi:type II restriction enzyme